jgi:hypothetical protein
VIRVAAIQPTTISVLQHAAIAQVATTASPAPQQREQTDAVPQSAAKDSGVSSSVTTNNTASTADRAPAFGGAVSSASTSSTQGNVQPQQQQQQQPQQQRAFQTDTQQLTATTAAIDYSISSTSSSSNSNDSGSVVQPHFVRDTHTTAAQAVPTQPHEHSSSSRGSNAGDSVNAADNTKSVPHNTPVRPDTTATQEQCDSADNL